MTKHKVKKCESCNGLMQALTGCMNCKEELIAKNKVKKVMEEFKQGELHSGHDGIVKDRKQAVAIALHEARKEVKNSKK